MKSFLDFARDNHLCWTHVDHDLAERAGLIWPHLKDLPVHDYNEVNPRHEMTAEEENHHMEAHRKIRRSEAYHQQVNYKHMSDIFNMPLRNATRSGGGLILKAHHYENDDIARNYGMDLRRSHENLIGKVHDLEGATDRATPREMHVYRGVHIQSGIQKLAPGRTFTDHGFTGTSFSPDIARSFAGEHDHDDVTVPEHMRARKILAKIHVPEGSRGHYLDIDENTPHHEQEFLLHRGTHFRVDGHSMAHFNDSRHGQVHVVHMSVIGNHPKELINPYHKPQTFVQNAQMQRLTSHVRSSFHPDERANFDDEDLRKKLKRIEF